MPQRHLQDQVDTPKSTHITRLSTADTEGVPDGWWSPWTDLASRPDVALEWVHELPAGMRGFWQPNRRTILLGDWLSVTEQRCVLAHELSHVDYRHRHRIGPGGPLLVATQEADADQLAARRLIDLTMLGVVADLPAATAAELLYVTPKVYADRVRYLHPSELQYIETVEPAADSD